VGGGILSAVEARAVADPADAKVRLRRSVIKALPSLAAARPQVELSALKAADTVFMRLRTDKVITLRGGTSF
jgi:hypothetical protein